MGVETVPPLPDADHRVVIGAWHGAQPDEQHLLIVFVATSQWASGGIPSSSRRAATPPVRLAVDGGWYFSDGPSPQRPPEAGRCSAHAVTSGAPFDVSGSRGTGGLVKAVVVERARSALIASVASATSGNCHGPE